MTGPKDVLLQQLETSDFLFKQLLNGLSDEECFKPPVPGGNHAAWIVGHIAVSEDSMVADLTGKPKRIPEATHELFRGGSTCYAGASKYPSRKQIDELYRDARANTVESLRMFDVAKWSDPSPERYPRDLMGTAGAIWGLISTHAFWHIGQLTVCRTAMGKKRVLG